MFWRKKCSGCGMNVDSKWQYCASCGLELGKQHPKSVSREIEKEFEEMDKIFHMKIPKFMLNPALKNTGIKITITSDSFSQPKIDVAPLGYVRQKRPAAEEKPHYQKPSKIPKSVEEPVSEIEKLYNKHIISINLPGVKNVDDIEVKRLSGSIEVKAFAGDKAYFKLIPVPSHASVNREFKDGILKIEVRR